MSFYRTVAILGIAAIAYMVHKQHKRVEQELFDLESAERQIEIAKKTLEHLQSLKGKLVRDDVLNTHISRIEDALAIVHRDPTKWQILKSAVSASNHYVF